MKIIDEREAWIHTHFFVDSALVTLQEQKLISMRVEPELRQMGIQYGLRYEKPVNPNSRSSFWSVFPLKTPEKSSKISSTKRLRIFRVAAQIHRVTL